MYKTPKALRTALEDRLKARSNETGIRLDRLRRRVLVERVVSRLAAADPGRWVLKGGMALEMRLQAAARLTKDIDLGLRADLADGETLRDRLEGALSADPDGDRFELEVGSVSRLMSDDHGRSTWRVSVAASLAGKPFGGVRLDISPRGDELEITETMELPNSLEFAGVASRTVEIIDLQRHAAEKFHGMLKVFEDRENTRVRDLADLVILSEHRLIDPAAAARAVRAVWAEHGGASPPQHLPLLPASWPDRYEEMAAAQDLSAATFAAAVALVERLWTEMFPTEET